MAKKLSSVLGIDIGSQSIKVCELRTQGKDPIVTALGMAPTPEGAVDHTGIFNPDAVGVALKQALANAGASTNQAVISIAGQSSVLVRTLEVPKMNEQELRDHMQWEINRNIPFAESTIVSDFKPLGGEDPSNPNMDVVMAIAPQSAIDTVLACMKKAGRKLVAIDVEPLSMARSIQRSYDDVLAGKTICMVDIGHKTTSINIYFGDRLLMPRQVPLGGELITRAIADALGVSMEDAERLKRERCEVPESAGVNSGFGGDFPTFNPFADDPQAFTPAAADPTLSGYAQPDPYAAPADPYAAPADPYAVAADPYAAAPDPYSVPAEEAPVPVEAPIVPASNLDPEQERMYEAIAPILEEFAAEIRRSIEYYQSRGGAVEAIEICGGGGKLKGFIPFIGRVFGITCDSYDPLRRLNVNDRKVAPSYREEHGTEFAVAVGNGLHIFFD